MEFAMRAEHLKGLSCGRKEKETPLNDPSVDFINHG